MQASSKYVLASCTHVFIKGFLFILVMCIVNVNNFHPFDLFILLNAAFRNSNTADSMQRWTFACGARIMRSNKWPGKVLPARMDAQKRQRCRIASVPCANLPLFRNVMDLYADSGIIQL